MMELMVKPYTMPDAIEFNFDELKAELQERARQYELAIYSDDQIKLAKADRAALNKLKKALNDERIRMEKEYMIPFNEFKSKINEIITIIDKPIAAIDSQVKDYEERQKQEKEHSIRLYMSTFALPYEIPIEKIFNPKWLNATVPMTQVTNEINERIQQIAEDLETIESIDEYQAEAIRHYAETLDLRGSINYARQIKEQKEAEARIEEQRKAKQDRREPEPQKQEQPKTGAPAGEWVSFAAYLTQDTARALRKFFVDNGIEYKRI